MSKDKRKARQRVTEAFFRKLNREFDSCIHLLKSWIERKDVPTHSEVEGFPVNEAVLFYFLDDYGIIATVDPRIFTIKPEGEYIFDWFVKDIMNDHLIITNDSISTSRRVAERTCIYNAFEYLESKLKRAERRSE